MRIITNTLLILFVALSCQTALTHDRFWDRYLVSDPPFFRSDDVENTKTAPLKKAFLHDVAMKGS